MNERIKELYEQAGMKFYFGGTGAFDIMDFNPEKLAELIVKECVAAVQEEINTGLYTEQQVAGLKVAKAVIKEHLGVE